MTEREWAEGAGTPDDPFLPVVASMAGADHRFDWLHRAAQAIIGHLVHTRGFTREQASSVCAQMRREALASDDDEHVRTTIRRYVEVQ